MKLVIFGLSVSSAWGNGHATLWRGLIRSLNERGHRVVFFEKDVPYYAENRDVHDISPGRLVLYPSWESVRDEARRELGDADVAMVTSYCPDGVEACRLVMNSNVPVRSFYDLDTPVTLAKLEAGESVPYVPPEGLSGFDLALSYTGGRALDALVNRLGARRAVPLYGSVDPEVHKPAPPRPEYTGDLSYLGTWAADRQAMLEELFVEAAKLVPAKRFVIGGSQYPQDFPWTANTYMVKHVPPANHGSFYSSSPVTLNVTRKPMADMGYCPSGRLFEAAACGVPVLTDDWEGLDRFFTPGEEILVARGRQCTVDALAMGPEALAAIGARARERALSEHTADHRARELVDILYAVSANPRAAAGARAAAGGE